MKEDFCPVCGSQDLDFGVLEVCDGIIYYPYECNGCQHEGKEWYNLVFEEIE